MIGDHFEDITNRQYRLFSLIVSPRRPLMVATDPNQSVGEHRGASPAAHERLVLGFSNLTIHHLKIQRRTLFSRSLLSRALPRKAGVPGFHEYSSMVYWQRRPLSASPALVEVDGSAHDMDNHLLDDVQRSAEGGRR